MAFGLNLLRLGGAANRRMSHWARRTAKYKKAGSGRNRLLHPFKARRARRKALRMTAILKTGGKTRALGGITRQRISSYARFRTARRRGLYGAGAGLAAYGGHKYNQRQRRLAGY